MHGKRDAVLVDVHTESAAEACQGAAPAATLQGCCAAAGQDRNQAALGRACGIAKNQENRGGSRAMRCRKIRDRVTNDARKLRVTQRMRAFQSKDTRIWHAIASAGGCALVHLCVPPRGHTRSTLSLEGTKS